jgi:hypothetical protein
LDDTSREVYLQYSPYTLQFHIAPSSFRLTCPSARFPTAKSWLQMQAAGAGLTADWESDERLFGRAFSQSLLIRCSFPRSSFARSSCQSSQSSVSQSISQSVKAIGTLRTTPLLRTPREVARTWRETQWLFYFLFLIAPSPSPSPSPTSHRPKGQRLFVPGTYYSVLSFSWSEVRSTSRREYKYGVVEYGVSVPNEPTEPTYLT